MARTLSAAFKDAYHRQQTGFITLLGLEIAHPDMASFPPLGAPPLRLVWNNVNVTHGGDTFYAYAFEITLPEQRQGRALSTQLRIDNVTKEIVAALSSLRSPPTVTIKVISETNKAANPPEFDTLEADTPPLDWLVASHNAHTLEGTLEGPSATRRNYPKDVMGPAICPGLFNS